jgi:plastocyanin
MRALMISLLAAHGWVWAAPLQITVTDAQGRAVPNVVIALEQAGLPRLAKPGTLAQIAQRNRQFDPRLLVIQTGTAVNFPNEDKVRHHVYSYSAAKTFELKLYLGQPAEPVLFDKSGVVPLGCNIHDPMSATVVVVDTPVYGVTDAKGELRLERDPAAGRLRAWHAGLSKPELLSEALPPGTSSFRWVLP